MPFSVKTSGINSLTAAGSHLKGTSRITKCRGRLRQTTRNSRLPAAMAGPLGDVELFLRRTDPIDFVFVHGDRLGYDYGLKLSWTGGHTHQFFGRKTAFLPAP